MDDKHPDQGETDKDQNLDAERSVAEPVPTGDARVDEAVAAVPRAKALDRVAIRRRFKERFSVERMARDYLALYDAVLRRGTVDAVLSSAPVVQEAANAA